jgi:hypothetical protein
MVRLIGLRRLTLVRYRGIDRLLPGEPLTHGDRFPSRQAPPGRSVALHGQSLPIQGSRRGAPTDRRRSALISACLLGKRQLGGAAASLSRYLGCPSLDRRPGTDRTGTDRGWLPVGQSPAQLRCTSRNADCEAVLVVVVLDLHDVIAGTEDPAEALDAMLTSAGSFCYSMLRDRAPRPPGSLGRVAVGRGHWRSRGPGSVAAATRQDALAI